MRPSISPLRSPLPSGTPRHRKRRDRPPSSATPPGVARHRLGSAPYSPERQDIEGDANDNDDAASPTRPLALSYLPASPTEPMVYPRSRATRRSPPPPTAAAAAADSPFAFYANPTTFPCPGCRSLAPYRNGGQLRYHNNCGYHEKHNYVPDEGADEPPRYLPSSIIVKEGDMGRRVWVRGPTFRQLRNPI